MKVKDLKQQLEQIDDNAVVKVINMKTDQLEDFLLFYDNNQILVIVTPISKLPKIKV